MRTDQTSPRPPAALMTPQALARLQPTRLSFSRALINRMIREGWRVDLTEWDVDADGEGLAQYRVAVAGHVFSFVAFSHAPTMEARTSRIIGGAWDMQGALIDGDATPDQVAQTRQEIPKLYAGRAAPDTLVWCRANRSMRAFEYTVDCLARGHQPDIAVLAPVGYLMRNTGLDANGTFGTRSFLAFADDHPLRTPYFPQMLASYLVREFSFDLADHLAACRSARLPPVGQPATLDPRLRSYLGLGNGSALGLVLWVLNHPKLVSAWIGMRERAFAMALEADRARFAGIRPVLARLADRAVTYFEQDPMAYESFADSRAVAARLRDAQALLDRVPGDAAKPVGWLCQRLPDESDGPGAAEAREAMYALLIECLGPDADALLADAVADESLDVRPGQSAGELLGLLEREYAWALRMDLSGPGANRQVWYKSRDAEEPRRGPAEEVPPGTVDLALAVPREVQRLADLLRANPTATTGELLRAHPEQRWITGRVQALAGLDYHTPHMNVHDDAFVPVDLIRLMNVAIYGIDKTRDYLGRNLRGLMFHGAPARAELGRATEDGWFWPVLPDIAPVAEAPAVDVPQGGKGGTRTARARPRPDRGSAADTQSALLRVSPREYRLVAERLLQLSGLPRGVVVPLREIVFDAEIATGAALRELYAGDGMTTLLRAPEVLDTLLPQGAGAIAEVRGVAVPGLLRGLEISGVRHGVLIAVTPAEPDAARVTVTGAAAPLSGAAALAGGAERLAAMIDGLPVDRELWLAAFRRSSLALSDDTRLSRRHAGATIVEEDGTVRGMTDDEIDITVYTGERGALFDESGSRA